MCLLMISERCNSNNELYVIVYKAGMTACTGEEAEGREGKGREGWGSMEGEEG